MKSRRTFASMVRLLAVAAVCSGAFLTGSQLLAQQGMISPVQADRAGLVVQWFAQLDSPDADFLSDLALVVDEDRATTYFQVSGGGLRETLSELDFGPDGNVFGVEGAKEFAEIRKEIFEAQLKRNLNDAEVTIEQFSIPETTLYTLSKAGSLNAIDAESGKLRWHVDIGDRNLPASGMGASKTHLAVVNGSNIYCLDAKTGKTFWHRQLKTGVTGSPVVNEHFIFVPTMNGGLEAIPFEKNRYVRSTYVANGQPNSEMDPVLEGRSVAWATDLGVTVARADKIAAMRFRIAAESPVVASPAARGGIIFMVSSEGFVYAVDEVRGSLLWEFPVGERITTAPIPVGNDLFVITDNKNLLRFDARTGRARTGWERPIHGIVQYVGASEERLYLLDTVGQLLTIDRETGIQLSAVSGNLSLRTFSNLQSDRLYICHKSGLLQCLRESGSERPQFHNDEWMEVARADPAADDADPAGMNDSGSQDSGDANPFGGDPFGGGSSAPKSDADANPFGGDPFGGGSTGGNSGGDTDPFGGGSAGGNSGGDTDPFGGGSTGDSAMKTGGDNADDDPFGGGGMLNDAADAPASDSPASDSPASPTVLVSTWSDVEPVFKKHCGGCHSARSRKGEFDLSTYAAIMAGGPSGDTIVASNPEGSFLLKLVNHTEAPAMPPNKKIPDADIAKIEAWIKAGALEKAAADSPGKDSGGDDADPFGG